jgi:hypothetical protein
MKIVLDFSAKVGREGIFKLTFRNESFLCIYFFFLPFRESKMCCPVHYMLTFKLRLHNEISTRNLLKFHCNLNLHNCQVSWLALQYQYYAFLWYDTM